MNNNFQTQFNPYQQNIAILKSYFRKPRLLTQGILYIASIVLSIASIFIMMPVMNEYINAIINMPQFKADMSATEFGFFSTFMSAYTNIVMTASIIPSVILMALTAAAFLIIYFKSKNNDPSSNPKAGVTILYVLSIIQLIPVIFMCLILALCIILLIIVAIVTNFDSYAQDDSYFLGIMAAIYTVVFGGMGAIFILYFINQVRYYKSILNGLSTVTLSHKGAGIYGVFSIIYGVYVIFNGLSSFAVVPMFNAMAGAVPEMAFMTDLVEIISPVITFSAITSALSGAISIMNAVIALGYKNHIKNITDGFGDISTEQSAVMPVASAPYTAQQQVSTPASPQSFQIPRCPQCNANVKADDIFCNTCGYKLK
ncbi:MAG: zinc ribbon domain-containing protein [Ruminococcaceae bacterium]|nr:zinc ribbon domain-containing protein [Oscillospiraceae bacterium]